MATTSSPNFKFKLLTAVFVITETIVYPLFSFIYTSAFTVP